MRRLPSLSRCSTALLLASATATRVSSCSDYSTAPTTAGSCKSTISSTGATSPAVGELVLTGIFYSDESVVLGYSVLGHPATEKGNPIANPATSITFFSLPEGTQTFSFEVTCNGPDNTPGHSDFPSATITIT
jgi:hypothetical protein